MAKEVKLNAEGLIVLKRIGIPTLKNHNILRNKLTGNRVIYFHDQISLYSVESAINKIQTLNKEKNAHLSKEPITIHLDSVGGSIPSALQLITTIRRSRIPVHIKANATICSAAIPVLSAGDHRTATDLTCFMHHHMVHTSFFESFTAEKYQEKINEFNFIEDKWLNFLEKRTKLNKKEWIELIGGPSIDKTYWFSATEALTYGLIDEIEDIWDTEKYDIG